MSSQLMSIHYSGELRQVHIDPETLDCEDNWRINRVLTDSQVEYLLDCAAKVEKSDSIEGYLIDAVGSYPGEDFAQDIITSLQVIVDRMRASDNKSALLGIVERLEYRQEVIARSAEYGQDQLTKAARELDYD